jgi:hypothetical protein
MAALAFGAQLRPRGWTVVVGCVALIGLLGACSGPNVNYVKSEEIQGARATAYFKLPERWAVYDEDEVIEQQAPDLPDDQLEAVKATQWLFAFDADPSPSIEHVGNPSAHPTGFARVRMLTPDEADYSVEDLQAEIFPLDTLEGSEGFELSHEESMKFPDGIEGKRFEFSLETTEETLQAHQIAAYDAENRIVYVFVITCDSECFDRDGAVIDRVISSWTVEGSTQ